MENKVFPKGADFYFLTPSIAEGFGGLTKAMLERAKLFYEKKSVAVKIVTFNYNPDIDELKGILQEKHGLYQEIRLVNMFEYFQGDNVQQPSNENMYKPSSEEKLYVLDKVSGKNAYRYYHNGLYKMYKSFEKKDGKLKFIDYFNENRNRTKREEFDNQGFHRKTTFMDLHFNIPRQEIYFSPNGKSFLSKWYKTDSGKSVVERINWFNKNGEVIKVFSSDLEMQRYWLENLLNFENPSFLVVDGRAMDKLALSFTDNNVYKIFVKHSTHLRPPYHVDSVLRLGNREVLNNINKADGIVFLTNAQKKDVELRFGKRNNYFVIPHAYKVPNNLPDFNKKNLKKVVAVARYHKEKQLDHIIDAFYDVVKSVPDAVLELYGFGDEESNLNMKINKLGLQDNVFVMGKTDNPREVFSTAALSVLTSKYEGFGLVVLESMSCGTPVVSYDIKYGPSDMIVDGENGSLVQPDNIDELANSIVNLLLNRNKLKDMSEQAYQKSKEFSQEDFIDKWGDLFSDVMQQKDSRNSVTNFDFLLTKSDWLDKERKTYQVKGNLTLQGNYPDNSIEDANLRWKFQNRENKEQVIYLKAKYKVSNKNSWELEETFPLLKLNNGKEFPKGYWDLSLLIEWNNSYQEKRIGYQKTESAGSKKQALATDNNLEIKPYYTKPYGNLTFHITKQKVKVDDVNEEKEKEKVKVTNKHKPNLIYRILRKTKRVINGK